MTELDLLRVEGEPPAPPLGGSTDEMDGTNDGPVAGASDAAEPDDAASAAAEARSEPAEADGDGKGPGPGQALDDETLLLGAAALLFASPDPLTVERLVQLLERPAKTRVRAALAALAERLDAARLPIALCEVAGGWRLLTRPDQGEVVQRLAKVQKAEKVTPAALETLAIVAYRQPVTHAEVEAIRGVQSGAMLRTLVDRGLVRVTGRADQPGAPLLYGTTKEFLDRFGLASLRDLPRDGELARD